MIYFSGFCLKDEAKLFENYLEDKELVVSGFSAGAIDAFEYCQTTTSRVDKLQLISPAFFQNKEKRFITNQLLYFEKNKELYKEQFFKNITNTNIDIYKTDGKKQHLKKLLNFVWEKDKLKKIKDKGIQIELFLGLNDKIIDSDEVAIFFKDIATVYLYKNKGHIL